MRRLMSKFTGKYKILMPRGYTFQKLYARNHRCYHKGGINDKIWIWVLGNDIEIMDFYSKSGWLIQKIVKNRDKILDLIRDGHLSIRMNTKNGKVYLLDIAERRFIWRTEYRLHERKDSKKALDLYYEKWKQSHIPKDMITEILRLYDAGLIKLVEVNFPDK